MENFIFRAEREVQQAVTMYNDNDNDITTKTMSE